MTLIEKLAEHIDLKTEEEKDDYISSSCPCDFDIFGGYIQGKKEYCHSDGCDACWNGKPLNRIQMS